MARIRVALRQSDTVVGDIEGNAERILSGLGAAEREGADVVAETDKIVMRLHGIIEMFGGFAGSLIWQNSR